MPIWPRSVATSCVPPTAGRVAAIESGLSDPHNGGYSVLIVRFEDGSRVVYKPKDMRLDAAWHALVERLNRSGAPLELKAVRAIARDGYGWTEFIDAHGLRRRRRLPAFLPAGRRLACAVPLLRRHRHAPGEHDRGGRASGADRPGNDPAGSGFGAADRRDRSAGVPGRHGNCRQFGPDGRPGARLWTLARQQGLRQRRHEFGVDIPDEACVEQHQFRHHAADEDQGSRRDRPEPAACRRPLRQVRRPHRRFRRRLRGLRQVPAVAKPGRKPGRAVRRLCRTGGPQGHSPDPLLLHAAAAAAKSPHAWTMA